MTTILVASTGGHLAQLVELAARFDGVDEDCTWVTFDSDQSRSLLAGRRTVFVRSIEERDVLGVGRGIVDAARILREENATTVVSTGSGIALAFLPYAVMRGIPAFYIESAARVGAPSLTGRLLERLGPVHLFRQYPHAANDRWGYAGSVFDGFEVLETEPRPLRRIVVTFGTGVHPFSRLLKRLVQIIPDDVEVLWQTGSTPVEGLPIEAHPFVAAAALDAAIAEADVVIGHAGCGFALSALNAGKYPILVPRDPRQRELVDDHQIELARFLADLGVALGSRPETISLADLRTASSRRVARREKPPTIKLAS
jgi:UDP-N-acetylglucosamine--N-acetylmuramyl-(pentapeptide) pyrophosphoryl-undecaprenol N-acetylglucosamine transferase